MDGTVTFDKDSSHTNVGETTLYSYTYAEEAYTPEGALQSPPIQAGTEGKAGTEIQADAYYFAYDYDGYQSIGLDIDRDTYDMLFVDTVGLHPSEEGEPATMPSKAYWLASPGVISYGSDAGFGPGFVGGGFAYSGGGNLFGSDGSWAAIGFAVRPVVILKSDITVDQVQVIPNKIEETWTTIPGEVDGGTIDDM